MPRPDGSEERRRELLPVVAAAFAELGYRRTTTAELARRTGHQETVLYRLWPDKKAMFVAAIGWVYRSSELVWSRILDEEPGDGRSAAQRLVDHEATHLGELGLHRIVFAGLSETDDPEIRAALRDLYRRFQRFIRERVAEHGAGRKARKRAAADIDPDQAAWALLGVGTVTNVLRELELVPARGRAELFRALARLVLEGATA